MRPVCLYEPQLRLEQTIGVYAGACNAKCNCRRCKKPTADFADTGPEHLGALRLQADTEAIRAFGRGTKDRTQRLDKLKANSLHAEANGLAGAMLFGGLQGYHILLPMDTLHVMPQGIIRLLRWAVMQAANKQELDHRLSKMPPVYDPELRGLHWRNFATVISTMTVLIEYFFKFEHYLLYN